LLERFHPDGWRLVTAIATPPAARERAPAGACANVSKSLMFYDCKLTLGKANSILRQINDFVFPSDPTIQSPQTRRK
jgi:hypothetical protein